LASRITSLKLFLCIPSNVAFLLLVMLLPKDLLVKQVLAVQGLLLFGLAVSLEWVYQGEKWTPKTGQVAKVEYPA